MSERGTMKPSEVLERAADLIEERGWCQIDSALMADGTRFGYGERPPLDADAYCATGAIRAVIGGSPLDTVAWDLAKLAERYVAQETGSAAVWMWNDKKTRTPTEVIDALRFAAKHAREDELIADEALA